MVWVAVDGVEQLAAELPVRTSTPVSRTSTPVSLIVRAEHVAADVGGDQVDVEHVIAANGWRVAAYYGVHLSSSASTGSSTRI